MRSTFAIEVGWCGFGMSGGLVPEVRCGVIRCWFCRGSVAGQLSVLRVALAEAVAELKRGRG